MTEAAWRNTPHSIRGGGGDGPAGEGDGYGARIMWIPVAAVGGAVASPHDNAASQWDNGQLAGAAEGKPGLQLLSYLQVIYKYKWLVLAVVVTSLAWGLAVTLLTPKVYTASTTIEIDRGDNHAAVVGNLDSDQSAQEQVSQDSWDEEFFQTQYGLLKSRSLARRVAMTAGLTSDPAFLKAMGAHHPPSASDQEHGWGAGFLMGGLGVYPVRDSRLVNVTFDSPDPALSARIANAFADNFIASNLQRRFEASAYARQFLEDRLADLKAKLENSERQLVAYATEQQIIQVSEDGGGKDAPPPQSLAALDLGGVNTALTAAKANLVSVSERYRAAEAAPGLATPDVLGDPTVQQLRQEQVRLTVQYNQQLKTYKPEYPDMIALKQQLDDVTRQLNTSAETIRRSLKTQYDAAQAQTNRLQSQLNQQKTSVLDERNREIQYNILQREVDSTRTLYEGLLDRYKQIGVAGAITSNNISIVDRADPPGGPSRPQPLRNLALAGVAGAAIGSMLAFLLETMDQAIRRPADVEAKLGLPVLGSVPLLGKGMAPMEALADLRSPFSEAYHSIRSNLAFSTKDGVPKVLSVTSARPGEGKSTTAFALAQGFARAGMRVLLVDLDLRNPSLHKTLGVDNRVGASSLLTGAVRLQQAVQPTDWPNLFLITSGPLPPSPAELLIGPRLVAFTKEAAQHFDITILDGPPVTGLADAPLIASAAAGAVLAIECGRTSRAQARAAIKRVRVGDARLFGAFLTKFDPREAAYGYGYIYEYNYGYAGKKPAPATVNQRRTSVLAHVRSTATPPPASTGLNGDPLRATSLRADADGGPKHGPPA
jgi:polysaccharide biosynthesis transport protein